MSELPFLLVVFWAAVNPPASIASLPMSFGERPQAERAHMVAAALVIAGALLVLLAATHEPLLDFLEVSPPSFDVAAGIVMLIGSLRPLWRGRALDATTAALANAGWRASAAPLAVPLLATPAALAAAISYGERASIGETVAAGLIVVAVCAFGLAMAGALNRGPSRVVLEGAGRVTGALLVVVAVGLLVDGVLSI